MDVKGRDLVAGIPRTITIKDDEIREALAESVTTIIRSIRVALEATPPELSADISDRGIVLSGGGALLATSTCGSGRIPGCRSRSPKTRLPRWCWARARCSITSLAQALLCELIHRVRGAR